MGPLISEQTDWSKPDRCFSPIANIFSVPLSAQLVSLLSRDRLGGLGYSLSYALLIDLVHRNPYRKGCVDLHSYATRDIPVQRRKHQSLTGPYQAFAVFHLSFSLLWCVLVSAGIDDLMFGEAILDPVALSILSGRLVRTHRMSMIDSHSDHAESGRW